MKKLKKISNPFNFGGPQEMNVCKQQNVDFESKIRTDKVGTNIGNSLTRLVRV